jgi:ABC-2 type transport system ATP-binding protein
MRPNGPAHRPLAMALGRLAGVGAATMLLAAGCSGGAPGEAAPGPTTTAPWTRPACTRPAAPPVVATAVEGVAADVDVTSFDGTAIRAHWFPRPDASADHRAPTVLMGPGWGSPGDTNVEATGIYGGLSIGTLRDAGFNVLTWDPRGFGQSGGTVTIDSQDFEGRDVQTLLDWVAGRPEVQLDAAGDPRAGMAGVSYGGGIQLVTAAIDCRVDALVPVMAWHSLITSLYKSDTPKTGWSNLLSAVAASHSVDPHITSANESGDRGVISPEDVSWFAARGPGDLVRRVQVPTLIISGTVDTLFTLDEAVTNYRILRDNGVPASMVWYCGGHGTCLTDAGDPRRVTAAAVAWLRRHVAGDGAIDTGTRVELIDQNGTRYPADDYPLPAGAPIVASGSGTLALRAEGGAGPAVPPAGGPTDTLRGVALPITPGRAANAVDVGIDVPATPVLVAGAPQLELTYRGTAEPGDRPTRVFAQVVDDRTGLVLGNQITPVAVELDGAAHTVTLPLEIVAYATTPGQRLTLQLVATTVAYAQPRLGGSVTFDHVGVSLPVAGGVTPSGPPS